MEDDPLYLRTRREAFIILGMWACCFLWTVPYCYLYGYRSHEASSSATGPDAAKLVGPLEKYNRTADSITYPLGLGIPDWVFWGIVVPWGIAMLASILFCLFVFHDEDLAAEGEELNRETTDEGN